MTNKLMNLPASMMEVLGKEEMLLLFGGDDPANPNPDVGNNGTGVCTNINNTVGTCGTGNNSAGTCTIVNQGSKCIVGNNSVGTCH